MGGAGGGGPAFLLIFFTVDQLKPGIFELWLTLEMTGFTPVGFCVLGHPIR